MSKQTTPRVKPHPADEKLVRIHASRIAAYSSSPIRFVKGMWGLIPQGVKPEYEERWEEVKRATGETWERLKDTVDAHWFGDLVEGGERYDWEWYDFEKGKHMTWQQTLILMGVEKAIAGDAPISISVRSGHGIGKSAVCAWLTLWYLYCFFHCQVPVTAPTSHQMHDVLWKEMAIWIGRMDEDAKKLYVWTHDYVRMAYDPESWFARARTSTKENTEAIAGVHADNVMIVVDEASGVPEQVYDTAEGALTSGKVLVVLISNPTRVSGYFYDSHNKNADDWQKFTFNCEQSPIVDKRYVQRQEKRHGLESDQYKIRVKGEFPDEGIMDDTGYMQLISTKRIEVEPKDNIVFVGRKILGIDPSGEGKDHATYVLRDRFRGVVIHREKTTNPKRVAEKALTFIDRFKLNPQDVVVDSFGIGSDVGKEVAIASKGKYNIYTVLLGNTPKYEEEYNGIFFNRREDEMDDNDTDLYLNLRALGFFRARNWLWGGGYLVDEDPENSTFAEEMAVIKYKRSLQGNKIQIMSKKEMTKLRITSPNMADGLMLTFLRDMEDVSKQSKAEKDRIKAEEEDNFDPHDIL